MPKKEMDNLAEKIGKLTGVMEGVIKSNDANTAEQRIFNKWMHESKGAQTERDKHYKRVKHGTFASIIISICAAIKAWAG